MKHSTWKRWNELNCRLDQIAASLCALERMYAALVDQQDDRAEAQALTQRVNANTKVLDAIPK